MCMTTLPVKYYHVNCNVYVGVVLLRSLHTFLLHQWSSGRRLRVPQCCSRRRIRKYTIYRPIQCTLYAENSSHDNYVTERNCMTLPEFNSAFHYMTCVTARSSIYLQCI